MRFVDDVVVGGFDGDVDAVIECVGGDDYRLIVAAELCACFVFFDGGVAFLVGFDEADFDVAFGAFDGDSDVAFGARIERDVIDLRAAFLEVVGIGGCNDDPGLAVLFWRWMAASLPSKLGSWDRDWSETL